MDYELLRLIGKGGYGEVWLARDRAGAYRAVKVVFRESFDHDRPYEREYEGIRKFEPISRSYENQVQILHVGRQDDEGRFYYIMELADDETRGQEIDPGTYVPKTLKSELKKRGRLPVEQCLRVAAALAGALENLHQHGLIHRDIKPGNIIFVNGLPKLADIGLVTDRDVSVSYVGTEGYIPPEGPSSPQADIYSLGKVLYEMATGRDRLDFPELPTNLEELPDRGLLLDLNAIIAKACAREPKQRYRSAREMFVDLAALQGGKGLRTRRVWSRRAMVAAKVGALAVFLGLVGLASYRAWKSGATGRMDSAKPARGGKSEVREVPGESPFIPPSAPPMALPGAVKPDAPALASPPSSALAAQGGRWTNSLGMVFVPVAATKVLFSIWDTRVQDYARYAASNSGIDASWLRVEHQGVRVSGGPEHPVTMVSWEDAKLFSEWLTRKERASGLIGEGQRYRLPSDVEWSVAVGLTEPAPGNPVSKNGQIAKVYPWGTAWPPPKGSGNFLDLTAASKFGGKSFIEGYDDGFATTSAVGSFRSNRFGLYDMGGNVWQWCEDYWDSMEGSRVLRGGSWTSDAWALLSSRRVYHLPDVRKNFIGFRCVLTLPPSSGPSPNTANLLAASNAVPISLVSSSTPVRPVAQLLLPPGVSPISNMVWIRPGRFIMGNPKGGFGGRGDQFQHEVTLTKGFFMGQYEVTQREYVAIMRRNPSRFPPSGNPPQGWDRPVEQVPWLDAVTYCAKLTQQEQAAGRLPAAWRYRLPTEAEWEYACRAGTTTAFHYGQTVHPDMVNYDAGAELVDGTLRFLKGKNASPHQTMPVGTYQPNAFGLYDMHGNVWEWCQDWFGPYSHTPVTDPQGPASGRYHVIRGGSWADKIWDCVAPMRGQDDRPKDWINAYGFRVVLVQTQP
jgi:formylglycine-generating enzyme required for sulfatase activity